MSSLSLNQVEELKERFHLTTFIETGCHLGGGVSVALAAGFEVAYSCDVSHQHAAHCRDRFQNCASVTISESDSMSFLKSLCAIDLPPSLFWLDAHFPAFFGLTEEEKEFGRFPLLDELRLISTFQAVEHHVILADDMRVVADELNPRWRPGETDDYFTVHNLSIQDLVEPFLLTHDAFVDCAQEGILVIRPRNVQRSLY